MCYRKTIEQLLFTEIKTPWHIVNVIMMVNNAGDVFKLYISTKRKHKLYSRYARYISY